MEKIAVKPNSKETVRIENGKVGFLWQVNANSPIRCSVDGVPIECGIFNPPYLVKRGVTFISTKKSTVSYDIEIRDDIYEPDEEPMVNKDIAVETKEVRPTVPHIINHILTDADVWYEIRLPPDTKAWSLKTRGRHEILYSFEPSQSTYVTLERGTILDSDTAPNQSIRAVYIKSEEAGVVVEIHVWRY